MGGTIVAYIFIAVGVAILAYATIGRLCGFHRPIRWQGGGYVNLVGELSFGVCLLCFSLAALQHSDVWPILAFAALVATLISQLRAERRHRAQEKKLRERNAADYPGVFDNPPPEDIDSVYEDELDLFDAGASTYLGKVARQDIKALIDRFSQLPDQGPNDIFSGVNFPGY